MYMYVLHYIGHTSSMALDGKTYFNWLAAENKLQILYMLRNPKRIMQKVSSLNGNTQYYSYFYIYFMCFCCNSYCALFINLPAA